MTEIGISAERVRQIHAVGLRMLRIGKARRQLEEKCEIVSASIYRTGFSRFKHSGGSSVENVIMRLEELEKEHKINIG